MIPISCALFFFLSNRSRYYRALGVESGSKSGQPDLGKFGDAMSKGTLGAEVQWLLQLAGTAAVIETIFDCLSDPRTRILLARIRLFFWKSYKSLSFGVMNIQPIAAILIYFDVHQFCNTSPSDRLILFSSIVCVLSASQLLEMTIPQDYTRSSGEYRGHETHRWSREESRTLLWQRGCWYCCGSLGVLHCKGQRVELL